MGHNAAISEDEGGQDPRAAARAGERARDARWVEAARAGDPDAFGHLYDAWIGRTFHLAARILQDHDAAQEVCHDAFLAAWRSLDRLEEPASFGGWLLRITRNTAYNRSVREARSRPVDDQGLAVIEGTAGAATPGPAGFSAEARLARHEDPEAAADDGEIAALVAETVAALGERDSEVLDLQLRFDLSPAEIGEVLGMNRNAANQLCHRVRNRFATAFRARMLWHGGRPACDALASELATAGVAAYGSEAVRIADRHAASCAACTDRATTRVQPSALFAAVPLLAAPAPTKAAIAAALAAHGVPIRSGASALTGWGTGDGGSSSAATEPPSAAPPPPAPPAPPPSPAVAARALPSRRATAARVAVAALATAALVALALALRSDGVDLDDRATTDRTTTTTAAAATGGPGTTSATDVPTTAPGTADDATTSTTQPTTTTTPPPEIVRLELVPDTPQVSPYPLGPGSPTLHWEVRGATTVAVWSWYDDPDGVVDPRRREVVSTDPVGALQVCPGTRVEPSSCQADAGRYTYTIEATGPDGTTIQTPQASAPGFEVTVFVIG